MKEMDDAVAKASPLCQWCFSEVYGSCVISLGVPAMFCQDSPTLCLSVTSNTLFSSSLPPLSLCVSPSFLRDWHKKRRLILSFFAPPGCRDRGRWSGSLRAKLSAKLSAKPPKLHIPTPANSTLPPCCISPFPHSRFPSYHSPWQFTKHLLGS